MCLINIDIVHGIDCLQVLQHADGYENYLTVCTDFSNWTIGPDIDGKGAWICSAAAGGICAAEVANSRSDKTGVKSWQYTPGNDVWKEGIINVRCLTHT